MSLDLSRMAGSSGVRFVSMNVDRCASVQIVY